MNSPIEGLPRITRNPSHTNLRTTAGCGLQNQCGHGGCDSWKPCRKNKPECKASSLLRRDNALRIYQHLSVDKSTRRLPLHCLVATWKPKLPQRSCAFWRRSNKKLLSLLSPPPPSTTPACSGSLKDCTSIKSAAGWEIALSSRPTSKRASVMRLQRVASVRGRAFEPVAPKALFSKSPASLVLKLNFLNVKSVLSLKLCQVSEPFTVNLKVFAKLNPLGTFC